LVIFFIVIKAWLILGEFIGTLPEALKPIALMKWLVVIMSTWRVPFIIGDRFNNVNR
jgi:hypothetical protein